MVSTDVVAGGKEAGEATKYIDHVLGRQGGSERAVCSRDRGREAMAGSPERDIWSCVKVLMTG